MFRKIHHGEIMFLQVHIIVQCEEILARLEILIQLLLVSLV
jgi:hypothetical protein